MSQKLQIYTSHLSRSNLLTLKVFLGLTRSHEVAVWEHTESLEAASAILVDADNEEGGRALEHWLSKNGPQVLIAFSNRAADFPPNVLVVPRPLSFAELLPVLQQAQNQVLDPSARRAVRASTQPVRVGLSGEKPATDSFGRTRRVLEVLYNSNQGSFFKITDKGSRSIFFNVGQRRYYTANLIQMEVEDLLASPIVNASYIEEIGDAQFARETQHLKAQDLEPPLWLAALAVSNGKLFEGLSTDGTYRLSRWPDLKKLGQDPLHLKLTALLRRGGTIDSFTKFTNESQEDIIDFINACRALNYLENHNKPVDISHIVVTEKYHLSPGKRSLLSRIRSRLGI